MGKRSGIRKGWTRQLAVLLILAFAFVSLTGAATITTTDYSQYTAEVVTSAANVTLTPKGVIAIAKTDSYANATMSSPTAGKSIENGGITKGNWGYQVEVQAITGSTPASAKFEIELKVNGTSVGKAYASSDATPATGEKANVYFDLGVTNLGNEQSFLITATRIYT